MKKIIIVIIAVAAILGLIVFFGFKKNQQSQIPANSDSEGQSQNNESQIPETIDFTQTGNLARNNVGFKFGVWYLVYEEPGAPALNVPLEFDDKSQCLIGEKVFECDSAMKVGARIHVQGIKQSDGFVLVRRLVLDSEDGAYRNVLLYFYNSNTDKDASGNVLCSRNGLAAVSRQIPLTKTPIQDTINLLLKGELSVGEWKSGIASEFPLEGFSLKSANLEDGVLTLEFADPNNKTSGGSCRASILWFQIEATALQFDGVKSVKFLPETLFQP